MNLPNRPKSLRATRLAFTLIGLGLFVFGSVLTARTMMFVGRAERTNATVVKVEKNTSHNGGRGRRTTSYQPTFRFTDTTGVAHTVTLGYSSSEFNYAVGAEVAILYDPQAPASICVATFFGTWLLSLLILGVGAVLLIVALGVHWAIARAADEVNALTSPT